MDKATFEHRQEGNKGAGHAKTVGRKKKTGSGRRAEQVQNL